ncbi:MAG: hypothetical protein IKS96_05355 [Fibrobacter sp.]|nr:hypothetical protein [Fibrobacter sp.]
MKKLWMLVLPILLCILSCEGFTTTGSNDPYSNHCYGISKKNAYSYMFFLELDCHYGETCKAKMNFLGSGVGDTLDGRCFSGYELRLETADTSRTVLENKNYPISLTPENHAKFSLVDEDNVEKKYDIDLSGIIHSYTVRGDSVDVNVMNGCRLSLYSCNKDFIYGSSLPNGKYSFLITDKCEDYYGYKCELHNQGPSQKDDLNIYATVYWKK